jgi:serine/threonine protein kinase
MSDWIKSGGIADRYRVVRELGSGTTGSVFLAERVQDFEQRVALKVLRWTPVENSAYGPIESEHVILRSLEHPNIVALLDHGRMSDSAPFLVLEYLDGKTIDTWCDTQRLSIRERLKLLMQVFSAVAYAHSRLVLHGDIKPANIMVVPSSSLADDHSTVKLLDFGISRWLHGSRSASRAAGTTVAYASPEQLRGDALTVGADVFALGILMCTLLSGVEAGALINRQARMSTRFEKLDSTHRQEIAAQRNTTSHALSRLLRGPLDAIVEKAVASAPEDRYVSVVAMAEDVNRYLENLETSVYPLGRFQQVRLWTQRHAWLATLTALMSAILLTSGGLTLEHHHRVTLQERATRGRLLDLAHLTDDLSGALYRSTEPLKGSEQARLSLLRAASTARDAVATESDHDPVLSLELARQYENAAELELAQDNTNGRDLAARELLMASAQLAFVPNSPARVEVAEKIKHLQARALNSF